jgi:hypothetical protein
MTAREFPILRDRREERLYPDARRSVPWAWVAPHEEQARRNHGQSLDELARRGGLSPLELWMAVHGVDLGRWLYAPASERTRMAAMSTAWLATWDGTAPRAASVEVAP